MSKPIAVILQVAGLTHLGYRFLNADLTYNGARITSGITESAATDGSYSAASPTIPAAAWGVYWNDSVVTSQHAMEFFDFIGNVNPSGPGTGPKAITIHTEDALAVDLGAVSINVQDPNDVTVASGVTDPSGDLLVNLLASTQYTINTFKGGYSSSPSVQTTGAGNSAQTLATIVLTAFPTPPAPTQPNLCVLTGILLDGEGDPIVKTSGSVTLDGNSRPLKSGSDVIGTLVIKFTTDEGGFVMSEDGLTKMELIRTDAITQADGGDAEAFWTINCAAMGFAERTFVLEAASFDLSDLGPSI